MLSRDNSLPHYEERKDKLLKGRKALKDATKLKLQNSPFGEHLRKTPLISRRAISSSVAEVPRSQPLTAVSKPQTSPQ